MFDIIITKVALNHIIQTCTKYTNLYIYIYIFGILIDISIYSYPIYIYIYIYIFKDISICK